MTATPTLWALFAAFVAAALVVDFASLRRQGAHAVTLREAAVWSVIWVLVSMAFLGGLWWYIGGTSDDTARQAVAVAKAMQFITS